MKKLSLFLVAMALIVAMVPSALAQTGTFQGSVKGEDGKPLVGAVLHLVAKDTGHAYDLKTDKRGNFFSMGVAAGTYDITIMYKGEQVDSITAFPVKITDTPPLNINIQEERKQQTQQPSAQQQQQMSAEQKKAEQENDKAKAHNEKIQGLNKLLAEARADMTAGNFDQARQIMTDATQKAPTEGVLWVTLGDAQLNSALKDPNPDTKKAAFQSALESYSKALSLTPDTKPEVKAAIYNNQGDAYNKLGQTDDAIKSFNAAATVDPKGAAKYYFNEGAILTNGNHYKEANEAFHKAIQADPGKADAYYWIGSNGVNQATMDKNNKMMVPPGTEEAFNKYLELDPTGKYADQAKAMLQAMGATIQTSFGKGKSAKK